jgi:pimeloyl-ACP methyl ester carboxylesterase
LCRAGRRIIALPSPPQPSFLQPIASPYNRQLKTNKGDIMNTSTSTLTVGEIGQVDLRVTERGTGHPVTDIDALSPDELTRLSVHDPATFRIDPATLTEAQKAGMAANRATLFLYGGREMTDSTLRERLSWIALPTLVLWGEADRIVDPDYGRASADAIPMANSPCSRPPDTFPRSKAPNDWRERCGISLTRTPRTARGPEG